MTEFSPDRAQFSPAEFARAKTKYFTQFAANHAFAFRPHVRAGRTLAQSGTEKTSPDIWRNVSEHCLVEAVLADILAEELKFPDHERRTVVQAAILHDWNKPHEVQAIEAAMAAGTSVLAALEQVKATGNAILRDQFHIPEEVIALTDATIPPDAAGPKSLAATLLWYVDHIVTGTTIVPVNERLDNLERGWTGTKFDEGYAAANRAFSDAYAERYGGRSLNSDVNRALGPIISRDLADRIGLIGDPADLPRYLERKIEERIVNTAN